LEFKYLKNSCRPRGPPEPGGPCHGIIGILVNPALVLDTDLFIYALIIMYTKPDHRIISSRV